MQNNKLSPSTMKTLASSVVALALSAAGLQALPLSPGGFLFPVPAETEPVGGTVLFTTGPLPVSAATFSGTLTSSVIDGDTSNPLGGYTFVYELENLAVSRDDIVRISISEFGIFKTDVSYDGAGLAPTLATRSANGQVVGFQFIVPALSPGASSAKLIVQTDADMYRESTAYLIDGSVGSVTTLAPVPEPTTLGLGILGLLGVGGYMIRRKK